MPLSEMVYSQEVPNVGPVQLILTKQDAPLRLVIMLGVTLGEEDMEVLRSCPEKIHPALQPIEVIAGFLFTYHIRRNAVVWHGQDISLRTMPIFDSVFKAVVTWLKQRHTTPSPSLIDRL